MVSRPIVLLAFSFVALPSHAIEPETVTLHNEIVAAVCISGDGKWIASTADGKVVITDFAARREWSSIKYSNPDRTPSRAESLSFSPDSKSLLIGYTYLQNSALFRISGLIVWTTHP